MEEDPRHHPPAPRQCEEFQRLGERPCNENNKHVFFLTKRQKRKHAKPNKDIKYDLGETLLLRGLRPYQKKDPRDYSRPKRHHYVESISCNMINVNYMYIYIYIDRERDVYIYIYIYMYIHICIHM